MGDAAFSADVKDVLGRLTSVDIQEFSQFWGFKDDILTLKNELDKIEAFLHDAEERRSNEESVETWLKNLRSASLMVENVLEEISTAALLQGLDKEIKNKVSDVFHSDLNQFQLARKVKDISRKLYVIASQISGLGLTPVAIGHVDVDIAVEMPDQETSLLIHDSSLIIGRKKEMEIVNETICNKDIKRENGEIQVYGIWGEGGVGKTTLAQLVYNNERVNQNFELKCWVYVSQNFQVKEIIKKIIAYIDKRECRLKYISALVDALQKKLSEKKFLIVLDDVWIGEDEKSKWDVLSETLRCGAEGSVVMMTTRYKTTCEMMVKVPTLQHNLRCLSKNDSRLLFKKLAFAQGREGGDITKLEPIGKEIIEKCKRLPLAVKTIGSLMWSKSSTGDWERVKNNIIWGLQEENISLALKVSYDNLHPYLKRCFSYCCLFPKGYGMEKDMIVHLWVFSGLIPRNGKVDLYELGDEIFDCLVWRSFFHVVKDKKYSIDIYKIHDMMYDMAQHEMIDDCLVIEPSQNVITQGEVLHLSSSYPDLLYSTNHLGKLTSLRSLFMYGKNYECSINQDNHVYLRVLYLRGIRLRTLPESICKLKHLKYLNLSYSSIEVLPESIVCLQNLEMLILRFCYRLRQLPECLRYMSSLRLLDINSCGSLLHLPLGIRKITILGRLPRFHVDNKTSAKRGLGNLDGVEEDLEILKLENVEDLDETKSAYPKCHKNGSVLELRWSNIYIRESKREMSEYDKEVLEQVDPNLSLKKLSIYFYMGNSISPTWMAKLQNLVEIGFSGCKRCECIPPLGELSKLKVIKLLGMDSLEGFHKKDMLGGTNIFPCLQELDIFMCPNLISLPRNLPKLKILKLEECRALVISPDEMQRFRNLHEFQISGCKKDPKISRTPGVRIDYPAAFEVEVEDEDEIDEWTNE